MERFSWLAPGAAVLICAKRLLLPFVLIAGASGWVTAVLGIAGAPWLLAIAVTLLLAGAVVGFLLWRRAHGPAPAFAAGAGCLWRHRTIRTR
jgi:hypothetical protein